MLENKKKRATETAEWRQSRNHTSLWYRVPQTSAATDLKQSCSEETVSLPTKELQREAKQQGCFWYTHRSVIFRWLPSPRQNSNAISGPVGFAPASAQGAIATLAAELVSHSHESWKEPPTAAPLLPPQCLSSACDSSPQVRFCSRGVHEAVHGAIFSLQFSTKVARWNILHSNSRCAPWTGSRVRLISEYPAVHRVRLHPHSSLNEGRNKVLAVELS